MQTPPSLLESRGKGRRHKRYKCLPPSFPLSFRLPLAFPSGLPRSEGGFKKANEEVETARGGVKEGMDGTKTTKSE